MRTSRRPSERL